jgi:hypothetical protein
MTRIIAEFASIYRGTHEILSQLSCRDLNPGPPELETAVLRTRRTFQVLSHHHITTSSSCWL